MPETATNVSGSEMSLFTYVFDCAFECSQVDFEAAWKNAPKLVEKAAPKGFETVSEVPTELIDDSWPADKGTQFVTIAISRAGADRLRVEVRTTHE
jgi:hypothetical protein